MTTPHTGSLMAAPLLMLSLFTGQPMSAQYTITTLATSGPSAAFSGQVGIAADSSGNVYAPGSVPASNGSGSKVVVLKVNASGAVVVVVGNANPNSPFPGCGLSATSIGMTDLGGVAVDVAGSLYVAQSGNGPVLRVSGGTAFCLDGGKYIGAQGIAADNAGNVWVSLGVNGNAVYEITSSGMQLTVAGNGTPGCTGGEMRDPEGLALDNLGNLYIADASCNVVWKVTPAGGMTAAAGNGTPGFSGDGGPATSASINQPESVAVDANGNLYIADQANDRIREVRTGIINTIAGTGFPGYTGDGGPAIGAELSHPWGIAVGAGGKVYFNDQGKFNAVIRQLTPIPVPRDFAGNGRSGAVIYDPMLGQEYTALSNGNGTYSYVPNPFTPGFDTLRTGDFNGDGKADLVVYNSHTALAYIGMGNGDGTFAFQSLFWSPGYDFVQAGDLNGDGKTDFALYNSSSGTMYTGISNGDGTFTYKYTLISNGYTYLRLADFNGDGKADLFVYRASDGQAYLGIGDGAGGFAFHFLFTSPGYNFADVGDLNGDGKGGPDPV